MRDIKYRDLPRLLTNILNDCQNDLKDPLLSRIQNTSVRVAFFKLAAWMNDGEDTPATLEDLTITNDLIQISESYRKQGR